MTRIIWNLDTGLFVRRNKMILKTTFLGPLCYWAWRIFLITIITFCGVNLIFVIFILLGSKRLVLLMKLTDNILPCLVSSLRVQTV